MKKFTNNLLNIFPNRWFATFAITLAASTGGMLTAVNPLTAPGKISLQEIPGSQRVKDMGPADLESQGISNEPEILEPKIGKPSTELVKYNPWYKCTLDTSLVGVVRVARGKNPGDACRRSPLVQIELRRLKGSTENLDKITATSINEEDVKKLQAKLTKRMANTRGILELEKSGSELPEESTDILQVQQAQKPKPTKSSLMEGVGGMY